MWKRFFLDEDGAEMTEYILIIALIAIAAIKVVGEFQGKISTAFNNMVTSLGKMTQ